MSTSGPKLDNRARALVQAALVSARSNQQINKLLTDAGYEAVSDQTISTYRRSPEVAELLSMTLESIKETGVISLRGRLLCLKEQTDNLIHLLQTHDDVKSRDYNSKLILLVKFMAEISRLVDRFDHSGRGATIPDPAQSPQPTITRGQIVDAVELLVRQAYPERCKHLPPPAPHIARLLDQPITKVLGE